jgi:hypothetical protein
MELPGDATVRSARVVGYVLGILLVLIGVFNAGTGEAFWPWLVVGLAVNSVLLATEQTGR